MTRMTVNGEPIHYKLDPQTPLLWALRDASNLTSAKYGCDDGSCGACTVMVDGRAVMSCQASIASLEGAEVVTIEGLSADRSHPVQRAWAAEQVTQCGYCEPGFIMAVAALLKSNPSPGQAEIDALPNICRCGIYPRVLKAIAQAASAAAPLASVAQPNRSAAAQVETSITGANGGPESGSPNGVGPE
jgi:isoquinoline 1-oxidoreductase alpha subunit